MAVSPKEIGNEKDPIFFPESLEALEKYLDMMMTRMSESVDVQVNNTPQPTDQSNDNIEDFRVKIPVPLSIYLDGDDLEILENKYKEFGWKRLELWFSTDLPGTQTLVFVTTVDPMKYFEYTLMQQHGTYIHPAGYRKATLLAKRKGSS